MASGIQANNGGPVGYGQPNRGMRRRLVRPEDEQFDQMQLNPELADTRGQGQPPHVYPEQPQGVPGAYRNQGQWGNQAMPGRTPMGGGQDQYGQNSYSQQAYRNAGPPLNDMVASMRNALSTPMESGQSTGMPPAWQQRNGGFNPQRPGTEGSVDPRTASPSSGYGYGGVNNPQYTNPNLPPMRQSRYGNHPDGTPIVPNDPGIDGINNLVYQNAKTFAPLPEPQLGGDLAAATRQSIQNNYTDIAGMRDVFKPGNFMGQLEGFNTNSWGTGERGSDTLKNMMGTIFSNHDVSQPGALRRALPDILKALPEATIVAHANEDLIDPDGPGPMQPVDVIRSATPGGAGAAWQWGPVGGGQAPQGPQGPSSQIYNNAMTQGMPQAQTVGPDGAPEVQDQNSAMQFLQWLMQQQQQGHIGQQPSQPFV